MCAGMSNPTNYYALWAKYEFLRAKAFRLVMSDAVSLDAPEAAEVFELVGDMTEADVEVALLEYAATL
jgi:hypothetical protein